MQPSVKTKYMQEGKDAQKYKHEENSKAKAIMTGPTAQKC